MGKWATSEGFSEAKPPVEVVEVEGVGSVKIIGLMAGEKDTYENRVMNLDVVEKSVTMNNARAILFQMTVYDQHGNRLFAEKDIGKIATFPAKIVDPILRVARRLSAMGADELNELVKNSLRGRQLAGSGSDTDSPDTSQDPSDGSEKT